MTALTVRLPDEKHRRLKANIKPDGIYVDLTFGGGGHSKAILKQLGENGRLYAFDQDPDALKNNLADPRFTLIPQNFRFIKNYLRMSGVKSVGVTAGASAPEVLVDAVIARLQAEWDGAAPVSITTIEEKMHFSLPKGLRESVEPA